MTMRPVMRTLASIKRYSNNPRHNDPAVPAVAESIKDFGFNQPMVLDKHDVIIVGDTRYLAAQLLELKKVPCYIAKHLSKQEAAAYRLADNRTGETAKWIEDKLITELLALPATSRPSTGFSDRQLERLIGDIDGALEDGEAPTSTEAEYGGSTAMHRSSGPVKAWRKAGLITGEVLDFGCGHNEHGYHKFDSFHHADHRQLRFYYQTILCSYVLNVQPSDHLIMEILALLYKSVTNDGKVLIAVRSDLSVGRHQSRRGFQIVKEPDEWEDMLGFFFEPERLKDAASFTHWHCRPLPAE